MLSSGEGREAAAAEEEDHLGFRRRMVVVFVSLSDVSRSLLVG